MAVKVIRKQEIDTKDLDTIKYNKILEYVELSAKLEKAIQHMNSEKAPTLDQKTELKDLLTKFQTTTIVPKEKKLIDLVIATLSTPALTSAMDKKMD